jgi:predicted ATPase
MKYINFFFENYKGISKRTDLVLSDDINAIIGNNESGKTTILKGIDLIYRLIQGLDLQNGKLSEIRPKSSAFTGKIILGATLKFDTDAINSVTSGKGKKGNNELQDEIKANNDLVVITFCFDFLNNQNKGRNVVINIGNKTYDDKGRYGNILDLIKNLCPRVELYDDFEFNVPPYIDYNQIGVKTSADKKEIDWYKIFDNLLKESAKFKGDNVTFESHIVKWLETNPEDQDSIDQRLAGINKHLNDVITKDWEDITESDITIKEFRINPISTHQNRYELKVISKNGNSFSIVERSKGCRWFFCFKVVTEISKHQNKQGTLFLLDEPASNLHIHPQIKILKSLQKIVGNNTSVIYSTHSPSLIQCDNVDSIYVTKNTLLIDDSNNITLTKLKDYKSDGKCSSVEPFIMSIIAKYIKKDNKFDIQKLQKIIENSGIIKGFANAIGKKAGDGTWDFVAGLFDKAP